MGLTVALMVAATMAWTIASMGTLLAGWTHNIVNGPARRVDGGIDDRVEGGRDSGWAGEQQPMECQQQHQPAASTVRLKVSFRLRERQQLFLQSHCPRLKLMAIMCTALSIQK